MTIALAGSNCKELFTLLTTFFGKDTGVDPFGFLDGAPKIKPPLDLTDTDTEDETGDASSTTSTATPTPTAASTSGQHKSPRVKPQKVWMDRVPDISQTEGHLPTDPKALHNTGIPSIYHVRRSGASSKGSSFILPFRLCMRYATLCRGSAQLWQPCASCPYWQQHPVSLLPRSMLL